MFVQEGGFEKIFQTKSYSGDNMVYCGECEKKTEATTVSFLVFFYFKAESVSQTLLCVIISLVVFRNVRW